MSFYQIVRTALEVRRQRGVYAAAKFLKVQGVYPEDRRKVLAAGLRGRAYA